MCDDFRESCKGECDTIKKLRVLLNENGLIKGLDKFYEEMEDNRAVQRQVYRVKSMISVEIARAHKEADLERVSTKRLMEEVAKRIDSAKVTIGEE